jgi:hypothetical protein
MLARPVPGLAEFLQVHSQASLQMALQKLRSIRFANDQLWPRMEIEDRNVRSALGAAGPFAERVGDSETGESASLLASEYDSEAPAWLAKRSPAAALHPCQSVSFDSVVPTPSPFGPTFGCSFDSQLSQSAPPSEQPCGSLSRPSQGLGSPLPRGSIVVQSKLVRPFFPFRVVASLRYGCLPQA